MSRKDTTFDLKDRDDKKWEKHRRDILKLSLLLTGEEKIQLKGRMKQDFDSFVQHVNEKLDQKTMELWQYNSR